MTARGRVALWTAGACLLVAVLLAPVGSAGFCLESGDDTRESYCRDWLISIVNIETSLWLWLGATAVVLLIGVLVWLRLGRRGRGPAVARA